MRPRLLLACVLTATGCARTAAVSSSPAPSVVTRPANTDVDRQLVVVITPSWDSTSGTLRRFVRDRASGSWHPVGDVVPAVVGRAGLAWGADTLGDHGTAPYKREGDGRAPAGMFPLDTVFGFAPASAVSWVRSPYVELRDGTECVDDSASVHYNTVVDRAVVPRVDWTSAEPMRRIEQYRLGVIVGYNARPPQRGRGSCIFLHIWADQSTPTSGCTAFAAGDVEQLVQWLDPRLRPMLVQLPAAEYARLRRRWRLP